MTKPFEIKKEHLQLLKKAIIMWDSSENGAPYIGAYGSNISDMEADVAKVTQLQASEKFQLIKEMQVVLLIGIQYGKISLGEYHYENPLLPVLEKTETYLSSEIGIKKYSIHQNKTIDFHLFDKHLSLLKNANLLWLTYLNAVGIDSKRPYGSFSNMQQDMSRVLGIEYNDNVELSNMLGELHQEMQIALQVL